MREKEKGGGQLMGRRKEREMRGCGRINMHYVHV